MNHFLLISLILFTLGLWGVLRSASLLKIFMSVEVMLASINLFILSLAGDGAKSSVFIMFVWLISVAEISIVLALFILMYRRLKMMDVNTLKKLKW
ncbi:NADH-quinone oxidoreductase subunit NuoK [Patescibacteria group bacterium]|nr:MAG: NADH-quinone oxidoreductase subunit NuoK [Patescibacteria group bacterium]